ncbi:hypothetical protein CANARDRAFT_27693 [[Candida] arabinofermentans NRRL YB-2248]|uniref:Mitochondrial import inner membrane translocase subunit TIM54 n=1 Tax=[Candida] arabinofermentans NRRL YB-2248 TaxID=983967 RepID=A0A1E4T410_9ASCO|nr:hypothetical protein CANARDRAFT_27693 [[Candida] arabinofermentans NRRL YB-2248]
MSDSNPTPESTAKTTTDVVSKAAKVESKGYTNPALQMMGIKRIKLPSRNWMIFWTVLGTLSGGIAYDKYQQQQIRLKYIELSKKFGQEHCKSNELPRKIRIYVVPPPNDYLTEGLKYFRKFVKPILNSSAIDFEIYTEERQGDIRYAVAEEIRKLRRAKAGLPDELETTSDDNDTTTTTTTSNTSDIDVQKFPGITPINLPKIEPSESDNEGEGELKQVKDLYDPVDVLGINLYNKSLKQTPQIKQDSQIVDPKDAGGVICIGRGAFKEYLNGIHEGLLGPLYKPKPKEEENTKVISDDDKGDMIAFKDEDDKTEDSKKAPKSYIEPSDYSTAQLAPELSLNNLKDDDNVPYFFTQPILVLRNYNISGFVNQFERLRRFYFKREQMKDYSDSVMGLVLKNHRDFVKSDLTLASQEEKDWPHKWVKTGIEKNSEWFKDFIIDDKVIGLLSVYEPIKTDNDVTEKKSN